MHSAAAHTHGNSDPSERTGERASERERERKREARVLLYVRASRRAAAAAATATAADNNDNDDQTRATLKTPSTRRTQGLAASESRLVFFHERDVHANWLLKLVARQLAGASITRGSDVYSLEEALEAIFAQEAATVATGTNVCLHA
uniref:Uncharacterized protein n=1 Tax=Trichogramma kaykai TaxID=54128 RepID=A0ABD2WSL4_9HYME